MARQADRHNGHSTRQNNTKIIQARGVGEGGGGGESELPKYTAGYSDVVTTREIEREQEM